MESFVGPLCPVQAGSLKEERKNAKWRKERLERSQGSESRWKAEGGGSRLFVRTRGRCYWLRMPVVNATSNRAINVCAIAWTIRKDGGHFECVQTRTPRQAEAKPLLTAFEPSDKNYKTSTRV